MDPFRFLIETLCREEEGKGENSCLELMSVHLHYPYSPVGSRRGSLKIRNDFSASVQRFLGEEVLGNGLDGVEGLDLGLESN